MFSTSVPGYLTTLWSFTTLSLLKLEWPKYMDPTGVPSASFAADFLSEYRLAEWLHSVKFQQYAG